MNELLKQLAEQANLSDFLAPNQKTRAKDLEKFAQAIVMHVMTRLESECAVADEHGEIYALATLQSLALQILDDFDMEVPMDDDWDAEAELQKIFDEFPNTGKDDEQI